MSQKNYQHEMIVPNQGFPFKLFLFEGNEGKYIREKHWHHAIEIFSVCEGSLEFILNDKTYLLEAGDFVIVNSNEVHAVYAPLPNQTVVLQIPVNLFSDYYTMEELIWFSHGGKNTDQQLSSLVRELYELYQKKEAGYEFLMKSRFFEIQYLLVTVYRELELNGDVIKNNKQMKRLGIITGFLKEHYKEEISLEYLAEYFGYSPAYLSRIFQKYAQINYKEYLQSIRLKYAVREMETSEKQIGEIALENGFANSKSFSNLFRKKYGILPSEYRKRQKNDI